MPKVNLFDAANDRNRKVQIAAVAIAIIVELGIIVFLLSGRSYEETANQFVDAVFNADAKAISKLVPAGDVAEEEYDKIVEELEEYLQSQVVDAIESYVGEDWKVTHRVLSVENLSFEELKELRELYKNTCDIRVSDAKIVEMELKTNAKDYDNSEIVYIHLIKVGSSWYIDSFYTSFHLSFMRKTLFD